MLRDLSNQIRFDDGAAYERYMGKWSQLAGDAFLDWLAPRPGLRWLDVGCGNGAFTDLILQGCEPKSVVGIDPSPAQLSYARARFEAGRIEFREGNAMALPFAAASFDVAVMPLVIFFVPDPSKGVAEMARVVRPGGMVSAYAWDMAGGGFPYASLLSELKASGAVVPEPPSGQASSVDEMRRLWTAAGLDAIDIRPIEVQRTFADFDDYWTTILGSPSAGVAISSMAPEAHQRLREVMRVRLAPAADGRITCSGRANAVKGRVGVTR
jgi:SAM-dependent methyltransferase